MDNTVPYNNNPVHMNTATNAGMGEEGGFAISRNGVATQGRIIVSENASTINDNIPLVNVTCDIVSGSFNSLGNSGINILSVPVTANRGEYFQFIPNPLYHEVSSDTEALTEITLTLKDHLEAPLLPHTDWTITFDLQYEVYLNDEIVANNLVGGRYLHIN